MAKTKFKIGDQVRRKNEAWKLNNNSLCYVDRIEHVQYLNTRRVYYSLTNIKTGRWVAWEPSYNLDKCEVHNVPYEDML